MLHLLDRQLFNFSLFGLGLSLDVFDTFVGLYVMDLVILAVNLVDRRKNTLQQFLNKTPLIAMHLNKSN